MRHSIFKAMTIAIAIVSSSLFISRAVTAAEFVAQQEQDQWLANHFIGMTVRNAGGESVGDINDLVLNSENKLEAAIIGVGGFLGIGEKDVAVSFSSLNVTQDKDGNRIVVVDLSKEALEAAPAYKKLKNPGGSTTAHIKKEVSEWGDKAKDAAKDVSDQAKKAYEDAKESMTDEKNEKKSY